MIDAHKLGKEARDRNSNADLNPFKENSMNNIYWLEGWVSRDIQLFKESAYNQ